MLQHRYETKSNVTSGESRKKLKDGAWLNPKRYEIGNQQRSSEKENAQRLSVTQVFGVDSGGHPSG